MTDDVQIFSHDERSREYPAPYTTVAGNVMASGAFPTDFNLWQVQAEVEPDAELEWAPEHGDEALYVLSGAIRLGEEICGPGSSVVIDSHVAARVHVVEPGSILHCGTWAKEPPRSGPRGPVVREGHGVAVIPSNGVHESHYHRDGIETIGTVLSDPRRPTCRLDLFRVATNGAANVGSHSHSEDEMIYVTEGTLRVGPDAVHAGMSIAIRGGRRYGFRTTGAHEFINYRADLATLLMGTDKVPRTELSGTFLATSQPA